jgi:thiol-disulfide isomerase/thioredoxin
LLVALLRIEAASFEEPWLNDAYGYSRALELQRQLKVPLIVYFYTDWCPYCRQLDAEYFPNPAVQAYLQSVLKVRINPEHGPAERDIADRFDVRGYPRFYVIRNPAAPPRNLQPFRRGGENLTPEQFAMVCQQFAPVSAPKSPASQMLVNTTRGPKSSVASGLPPIVTDSKLPSLDAVLQKYVDAIGGKDALAKVTTRVVKGKVDLIGVSRGGQLESYTMAPNRLLTVLNLQTVGVIKQGFDGSSG